MSLKILEITRVNACSGGKSGYFHYVSTMHHVYLMVGNVGNQITFLKSSSGLRAIN